MDKLRMRFKKTGRAAYISHLDLVQTIQRAFFRAELPLKYSEGYNPRPQLSALLPLSVGTESLCELMDFQLTKDVDIASIPVLLTAKLPEGIEIMEVYPRQRKPAELKWLRVEGRLEYDERKPEMLIEPLRAFFARESITVMRKTKRGEGLADIKGAISSMELTAGEKKITMSAIISAQEPTLNPALLIDALRQNVPELAPDFAKFTRIETYDREMKLYR